MDEAKKTEIDVDALWQPILALAKTTNAAALNQYVGAWHCRVDDVWQIAVNGHSYRVDVTPEGVMAATLEPFQCAVWWRGWLAAQFTVDGGRWLAYGTSADVDAFVEAVGKRVQP